jgi:hypothetical protein
MENFQLISSLDGLCGNFPYISLSRHFIRKTPTFFSKVYPFYHDSLSRTMLKNKKATLLTDGFWVLSIKAA